MNRGKNIGARILRWGLSALTYLINLPIVYLVFNLFPQSMQDVALGRPLYALAPRPLPPTPLLQRCLNYLLIIVVVFAIDILVLWCLSKLGDVKGTFTGSFEKGGGKITVEAANLLGAFAVVGVLIFLGMYVLGKVFS